MSPPQAVTSHMGTWQADLHGVAKVVTECLGVCYNTDPDGGLAFDQP